MRTPKDRPAIHPGEILLHEFLLPAEVSQYAAAKKLGISYRRLNEICNGRRPVTMDTAHRLSCFLGTSPELWLNMQTAYDLWQFQNSPEFLVVREKITPQAAPREKGDMGVVFGYAKKSKVSAKRSGRSASNHGSRS
jgi:antitoxin HigA-1